MESEMLLGLTGEVKEIVIEVIRAANSNPVIGILVSIIAVDMLYRLRLIGAQTVVALYVFLGVIEGGTVAANLIDAAGNFVGDLGSLIPSFGSKTTNQASQADLVTPSATTLVYGQQTLAASGETAALTSLINRIKSVQGVTK